MKRALGILILAFLLPVNGQNKTQPVTPSSDATTVNRQSCGQEEARTNDHPQSYLARLFSPENLPNLGLFVAGVVGIIVAICTLKAIQHQADIMYGQLTIPYRAYLGILEPDKPITERGVAAPRTYAKFPIINNGQVPARITSIDAEIIMQERSGTELWRRSFTQEIVDGEIPPGKISSYAVTIYWPPDMPNADQIIVSVAIVYDPGFEEIAKDRMNFVRVFSHHLQDWTRAYRGTEIDLTKSLKTPD